MFLDNWEILKNVQSFEIFGEFETWSNLGIYICFKYQKFRLSKRSAGSNCSDMFLPFWVHTWQLIYICLTILCWAPGDLQIVSGRVAGGCQSSLGGRGWFRGFHGSHQRPRSREGRADPDTPFLTPGVWLHKGAGGGANLKDVIEGDFWKFTNYCLN